MPRGTRRTCSRSEIEEIDFYLRGLELFSFCSFVQGNVCPLAFKFDVRHIVSTLETIL